MHTVSPVLRLPGPRTITIIASETRNVGKNEDKVTLKYDKYRNKNKM